MESTARTAGTLYGTLSSAATGQATAPGSQFDPAILAGRSADEVMDALVEAVRPTDGTQDGEVSRSAIRNSMSELLSHFPEANLFELSNDQRLFAIEHFVSLDVYNRIVLDCGKTIQEKAPSPTAALSRIKNIKDYVRQTVSAQFRILTKAGEQLGARRISEMVRRVLLATFEVFEDYVR